jgi:glycosyltransferase involved in cell wall biosynthesis
VSLLGHGAPSGSATAATPVRPVRVLHLLPDLAIGGGQTIVLNHLRHADRDRYDVRVAELRSGGELTADFVAVTGRQPLALHYDGTGRPAAVRRLVELLRANRVDLLHVHSDTDRKLGHAAALMTGIPVVGHLHAEWIHLGPMQPLHKTPLGSARSRVAGWARDRLEQRVVHHYIAESERVRDLFRPLVRQPITVMAQAIPVERFEGVAGHRSRVRTDLGLAADAPVLVCVSRLVEGKGQASVIEATARLRPDWPDLVLLLVGDGPERATLEALAAELGVAGVTRFLGSRHDVPDLLAAADVFVFASENEGFGLAVLEAMAASLPTVAFRIPSLEEFVVPGATGALVEDRDVERLALEVDALLRDPGRARRYGEAGRRVVVERFDPAAVARSFEAVYRSVLDDADLRRTRREATP